MRNIYLKATSEQELIDSLSFARTDNEWINASIDFAIDIIGNLYNNDGVFEEEICIISPSKIEGFHANIMCTEEIEALIPKSIIITTPLNPQRKWLGE